VLKLSVYERGLLISIARVSAITLCCGGLYLFIGYLIWMTDFKDLSVLMFCNLCLILVLAFRMWPVVLHDALIPYTRWQNYKRNYHKVTSIHRFALALPRPVGLTRLAEVASMANLGWALIQLGDWEEAETLYRKCLIMLGNLRIIFPSKRKFFEVYVRTYLVVALCQQEKFVEAELVLAEVFDAFTSKKTSLDAYEGFAYYLLGHIHLGLGESSAEANLLKGMKLLQSAKPTTRATTNTKNDMINACNLDLARSCITGGRIDEGNAYCENFFAALEQKKATVAPTAVRSLTLLANQYMTLHDYARAEKLLQLCYLLMLPTPFTPLAKATIAAYETLLSQTGRSNEIPDMKSWLQPINLLTSTN
jgi:tetratricopeptide (TPR) repeat protein